MKKAVLPVFSREGKQVKEIQLDQDVFDGQVNLDVLYQAVLMYRANQRKGLASTKTRGEVSGGGRKPWRQKGTGRARVGSIRSPLWRKGGVVFGPHPRDFGYKLPNKIRLAALQSGLNAKLNQDNLLVVDDLRVDPPKTKKAIKILSSLKLNSKSIPSATTKKTKSKPKPNTIKPRQDSLLLVLSEIDNNLRRAFKNISYLDMIRASDVNAYDILRAKKLILNLKGLSVISDRIKRLK